MKKMIAILLCMMFVLTVSCKADNQDKGNSMSMTTDTSVTETISSSPSDTSQIASSESRPSQVSSSENQSSQTSSQTVSSEPKHEYTDSEWRLHPEDFKLIAFTFDDGPGFTDANDNATTKIVDVLAQYYGKGTFFFTGGALKARGTVLPQYVLDHGCEVASHSYNHKNMSSLTTFDEVQAEIADMNVLLKEELNVTNKFFRAGGFTQSSYMWSVLTELNMPAIKCAVGFGDYSGGSATIEQIEQSLTGTDLCDGAIIGMHSTNPNCVTADGLSIALPILYGKGYRFCTLSELLELRGISYNDLPKGKYIDRISKQPDGTVKYN